MFRSFAAALLIGFCAAAPIVAYAGDGPGSPQSAAVMADPIAGAYSVKGDSFDGNRPYTGDVVVEKTGQTYRVIWYPGPNQIEGVGVYWGGQFSVGYLQEGVQGVAVYVPMAGGLRGVWSERGETRLAPEDWTKK